MTEASAKSLADLASGAVAEVAAIDLPADEAVLVRAMGLVPGARVEIGHRGAFGGPIEVRVGDTSLALGRPLAAKIRIAA